MDMGKQLPTFFEFLCKLAGWGIMIKTNMRVWYRLKNPLVAIIINLKNLSTITVDWAKFNENWTFISSNLIFQMRLDHHLNETMFGENVSLSFGSNRTTGLFSFGCYQIQIPRLILLLREWYHNNNIFGKYCWQSSCQGETTPNIRFWYFVGISKIIMKITTLLWWYTLHISMEN